MANKASLRVEIDPQLHQAVTKMSQETGVSATFVMRRALENWVATGIVPAHATPTSKTETPPAGEE